MNYEHSFYAKENHRKKVWMKYYTPAATNAPLPRCKAYDFLLQQNCDRLGKPALHYYGKDITWKKLTHLVDMAASAYTTLGV